MPSFLEADRRSLFWGVVCVSSAGIIGLLAHGSPKLFVLGLLAATCLAVGYLAWYAQPAYTLCAALTLMVFSGNWQYMGLPSSVSPDRAMMVLAVVPLVLRAPGARDRPAFRLNRVHLGMIAFIVYLGLSAAWAGTLGDRDALFTVIDRVGIVPFVIFAIAPLAFYRPEHRRALLITLTAVGAYLGFTGLMEGLGVNALVLPHYINNPEIGIHAERARGPFLEAEGQGLALGGCAIAALLGAHFWKKPRAIWMARATVALCLAGMLLTLARAVWVGAVLAAVITLVSTRGLRRFLLPTVIAAVLALMLALTLAPGLRNEIDHRLGSGGDPSVYDRRNQQATALRMIAVKPIFGFGWDRYQTDSEPYLRTSPDFPLKDSTGGEVEIVHNVALSLAVELGIVGVLMWLAIIAGMSAGAFPLSSDQTIGAWQVGYRAFLVFWISIAMFTPLLKPFTASLLFLWAGVLQGFYVSRNDESVSPGGTATDERSSFTA